MTHHTASSAPAPAAAPPPTNARIDGLDGIRALAVIGVILYHTDLDWSPAAGFLGVDVFFTLSGFLITALLLREHRATGQIDVVQFYVRRARRLLPALWLLLLFVVIAGLTISRDTIAGLRGDVPAALLYVSNWWQIYHGQSYFELIGRPAPLQHLWSLSIEEQFYLLWPALVIGLLARGGERLVGRASLALAGLITAWMWILAVRHGYPADSDPSRGYFGLDSHSMGLFAGAALAATWNPWRDAPVASRRTTEWAGWLSLAVLIVTFFRVTETTSFLYRGGFLLVAALTCALIYAVVDRRTTLGRLFSLAPLRWIGERSYGLYLWHWPVFGLLRPGLDLHLGEGACLLLRLGATFAIAELCYRYVERPIRTGRFAHWPEVQRQHYRLGAVAAGAGAIALGLLLYLQPTRRGGLPDDVVAAIGNGVARHAGHVPTAHARAGDAPRGRTSRDAATRARAAAERDDGDDDVGEVLAIGDSVILGASHVLGRTIDGLQIDAAVGRQARDIVERIRELKAAKQIAPRVILHLGTNGYVTEPQMRTILDALADRDEVVLINANAPRRWVDVNNDLFRQLAATHPNVTVFDWHGASVEHPEYFVSDRVHLSTAGLKVFTSELRRIGRFAPPESAAQRVARSDAEVRGIVVGNAAAEIVHHAPLEPRPLEETAAEPGITPVADVAYVADASAEAEIAAPVGPPLRLNPRPVAVDAYWDKVAACESDSSWTRRGGNGGLGIRARTWLAYGGGEFARTAAGATREQQIVVANRISTQGYPRSRAAPVAAVGFGGFGCAHRVGRPVLIVHTAESVLAQGFQWGQTGGTVEELQAVLDVPRSGRYDTPTWRAHLKVLASHEFPRSLAPESPLAYAGGRTGR